MKKTIKTRTDFFTLYRSSQIRKYFLSGGIAIFMAFTFVSVINGGIDTRGLMASVASVANPEAPRLEADIILNRSGSTLSFVFGAKAERVDRIEFTLLSDPSRFRALASTNPDIQITGQQEIGTYRVTINMRGADVTPGTEVAELVADIDPAVSLSLIDTEFISAGNRYSMTSKGE